MPSAEMTWIDFIWPMVTGACVTLGLINLRIAFAVRPRVQPFPATFVASRSHFTNP